MRGSGRWRGPRRQPLSSAAATSTARRWLLADRPADQLADQPADRAEHTDRDDHADPADPVCAGRAVQGLRSLVLAVSGELRAAQHTAQAALALPACLGQPRDVHSEAALLALALVHHEWDRPAEAQRLHQLSLRSRALTVEPELDAWSVLIGVRLRAARGDLTGAAGAIRAAVPPPGMGVWYTAALAELSLARGSGAAAPDLPDNAPHDPAGEDPAVEEPALAVLAALAALRGGDPHTAERMLPPWWDGNPAGSVLSVRLDAGLVEAQVAHMLGDRRRAGQALERVLDLAGPQGFRRPFSKDPDALRALLVEHLESGTAHWSTVDELVGEPARRNPEGRGRGQEEALTEREVTVLRYLQSMLSNEEIAAKLFVSVNTVKTHIRHIYRKLDVNQRRDAVRRGREARLL